MSGPPSPEAVQEVAEWNALAAGLPHAHILQAWEWGDFKARYGWQARRLRWGDGAAAQVLTRTAARGRLRVMYVPRGPLLDWRDTSLCARVLDDLQSLARRERAIFIKIDPGLPLATGGPEETAPDPIGGGLRAELIRRGWRFSPDQIQFRNTVTLDLRRSEASLLAGMKQKTRYNVRLAEKKAVHVRPGSPADLDLLYRLYAETSVRDGFVIRPAAYYRDAWGGFMRAGRAQAFIAEVEAAPVSALILFVFGGTAWYFYGMSTTAHRERMSNHLLQWEAIRWARAQGCAAYDFWGAPDAFESSDAMWGVWKFKEGFGGRVVRGLGAWDFTPAPLLYQLYTRLLPGLLAVLRRRGRASTRAGLTDLR